MDYSKTTKQELIELIEAQNKTIESLQDEEKKIEELKKSFEQKKVKELGHLEKQIHDLEFLVQEKEKGLEDQIKARDNSILKVVELENVIAQKEHVIKTNAQEKVNQEKSYKFLEEKFNELAKLFEEYMLAFKEQIKLSEVMFKNNNYVLQALEIKIKKFNGENPEKEGNEL
jgi:hypothetical protein